MSFFLVQGMKPKSEINQYIFFVFLVYGHSMSFLNLRLKDVGAKT